MKKETPHSWKRGAGLADGLTTVALVAGMPTTGRDQRQKRSPKEPSAVSGTLIQVSQVGFDHLGRDHVTRWALLGGSAPACKIEEGIGTARPSWRGLFALCFLTTLSNLQNLSQQLLILRFLDRRRRNENYPVHD